MNIILQTNELVKHLPTEEIEYLLEFSELVKFNANESIIIQGEIVNGIYIITKGSATTHAKLMGEGVVEVENYGIGSFLGEMSFIEGIPSPRSIIAMTETHCVFINRLLFTYLSLHKPILKFHLLNAVASQMCQRLNRMYEKISSFITSSDMAAKLTFIGKMIESLNAPEKIAFDDIGLNAAELQKLPSFMGFTLDEVKVILEHAVLLKVPKYCKLIAPNKKSLAIYVVVLGATQSSIEMGGKTAKLSVIGPGKLFLSPSLIEKESKAMISFTSCEKAILLYLPEEHIEAIKANETELWYKLFDLCCHSLAALEKSVYKLDIRLNIEAYNR